MNLSANALNTLNDVFLQENVKIFNCPSLENLTPDLFLKKANFLVLNQVPGCPDTDTTFETEDDYEYSEAIIYVICVLIWYSLAVIALICISTKKNQLQYFVDSDDPRDNAANSFLRQSNGDNIRQQALGKYFFLLICYSIKS